MPAFSDNLDVPVVLVVFNRPHLVRQVLAAIADVRPTRLLVVADGPRPHVAEDAEMCRAAREAVEAGIRWPSRVSWNVSDSNLGARRRVQTGLDWVFEQEEHAIVIEDDCVAAPTFFWFCRELLDRFRDDTRIATVCGTCPISPGALEQASYVFSRYPIVSGWATWSRVWRTYDANLDAWPGLRGTGWLETVLRDPLARAYWAAILDETRIGAIDTWDYQLTFSCWRAKALSIHPARNLVMNIGIGPDATHTKDHLAHGVLPRSSLPFPLAHPDAVEGEVDRDTALERLMYSGSLGGLMERVRNRTAQGPKGAS